MATRGMGISLAGMASTRGRDALDLAGKAADQEQRLGIENAQLQQQDEAGKRQLGATLGSAAGFSIGGPPGAMIGGAIGAIAGGLFTVLLTVLLVVPLVFSTNAEATVAQDVTQMELHQILAYDPETGVFTWLEPATNGKVKPGDRAGFEKKDPDKNYRYIKLGGRTFPEHRLAWKYMTGEWPEDELDHKNRMKNDNRFCNLRPATRKQNSENRDARAGCLSGFRGVSWSEGKWCAVITHFGKTVNLGRFDNVEDAKAERLKAEASLFTHSARDSNA